MKNEDEIIIHKNQTEIEDFLKVENKECLDCLECEDNICQSITCDYFNKSIFDFLEYKCIHKKKRNINYYEDNTTQSLF